MEVANDDQRSELYKRGFWRRRTVLDCHSSAANRGLGGGRDGNRVMDVARMCL